MAILELYRAMSPRWSFAPMSGEGAAMNGGRFNRVGVPTLYLAADFFTAIEEYRQGHKLRPNTSAQYDLHDANLADLVDPASRAELEVDEDALTCAWRYIAKKGGEPSSWIVADRLCTAGYHGLTYRSRLTGGRCVALWDWNKDGAPLLEVHDPGGLLPRNDASWRD